MKWLVAVLLLSLQVHAEPLACADLFRSPVFSGATSFKSIELVPETLPTDSSTEEFKAKLADLLYMWSSAIFHEDKKDPLKKRSLSFGRMVSETESVEFEYQADTRDGADLYRLAKVRYYKTNGQEIALSKDPVTDNGLELRRANFSLITENGEEKPFEVADLGSRAKDIKIEGADPVSGLRALSPSLTPVDREVIEKAAVHKVTMPLMIDGPMLESLKWWLARMPRLKATEISDATLRGSVSRLYWFSSMRASALFWAKNSQKQITKIIFWVAVIGTVGNLPGMNALMSYMPMHSKIERILHPHANNIEEAERDIVKTVLTQTKKKSAEISQSFSHAREQIKSTINGNANDDVRSIAPTVSALSDTERKLGGTPVFYNEALRDAAVETTSATIVKKYMAGFDKSYILASFKKQETIVLIPVVEDAEARETSVTVLRYTQKSNPETYAALDALITKKVTAARKTSKNVDPAEGLAN